MKDICDYRVQNFLKQEYNNLDIKHLGSKSNASWIRFIKMGIYVQHIPGSQDFLLSTLDPYLTNCCDEFLGLFLDKTVGSVS